MVGQFGEVLLLDWGLAKHANTEEKIDMEKHLEQSSIHDAMMTMDGIIREVNGKVPIAEMFNYSSTLRGLTSGRGTFSMEPAGYEPTPPHIQEKIVKDATADK